MGTHEPDLMQSHSDAQLVHDGLGGDEVALRALLMRYERQVFALCYRMLGHRHDAEDAAQEALVRVVRNLHRWDTQRPLRPWILTIAANRCRTLLVSRAKHRLAAARDELLIDRADRSARVDLAEELHHAIQGLPLNYRTALTLFHEQELSCEEVADVLGCPVGTAKVWLHRGRRQLAEYLQNRGVVPELRYAVH